MYGNLPELDFTEEQQAGLPELDFGGDRPAEQVREPTWEQKVGKVTEPLSRFALAGSRQAAAPFAEILNALMRAGHIPAQVTVPRAQDVPGLAGRLGQLSGYGAAGLIGEGLGGVAKGLIPALASEAPIAGVPEGMQWLTPRLAGSVAGWGTLGAADSPRHPYTGAAGAALASLLPAAMLTRSGQYANAIMGDLLQGTHPKDIPSELKGIVSNDYNEAKSQDKVNYNSMHNLAKDNNFILNAKNFANTAEAINKSKGDFGVRIKDMHKELNNIADWIDLSKKQPLRGALNFKDVHNFLIKTGEQAANASNKGDLMRASVYGLLKRGLLEDTEEAAAKTGNQSVMDKLVDANKFHRENVVPYQNKNIYNRIIKNEYPPDDAYKLIESNQPVVNKLNPNEKNLILYEHFKGAQKISRTGRNLTNPQDLWDIFSDLSKNHAPLYSRIMTPGIESQLYKMGRLAAVGELPIDKMGMSAHKASLAGAGGTTVHGISSLLKPFLPSRMAAGLAKYGSRPAAYRALSPMAGAGLSQLLFGED